MASKRLVSLQTCYLNATSFFLTHQSAQIRSQVFLPYTGLYRSPVFDSDHDKGSIHQSRSITIAIVEDERELLSLYSNYLRDIGYNLIFEATSGEDLLKEIMNNLISPDLLLIDYRLPGADGIDIAKRIVSNRPELRVIVTTADDSVRELAEAEGFEFLLKPFSLATLAKMLHSGSQSKC